MKTAPPPQHKYIVINGHFKSEEPSVKNIVYNIIKTDIERLTKILVSPGSIYTFLNPVSYLTARKQPEIYQHFDGVFADGGILARFINFVYGRRVSRISFDMTSIAPFLFEFAETEKKKVYMVGATAQENEEAVAILKERYPNLILTGRSGYFLSEEEQMAEASKIAILNPDFLIVGMGALKQEEFLNLVKLAGYRGVGFTCGGFIHQLSKYKLKYYPKWIDRFNLRFVYRIFKEKHTRTRYLKAAFLFPILFIWDKWNGK
jgi:N-acetylglucosaminyldiphosphoundecaprenol N-acetyl-beta-D-mannosaminyltransferase